MEASYNTQLSRQLNHLDSTSPSSSKCQIFQIVSGILLIIAGISAAGYFFPYMGYASLSFAGAGLLIGSILISCGACRKKTAEPHLTRVENSEFEAKLREAIVQTEDFDNTSLDFLIQQGKSQKKTKLNYQNIVFMTHGPTGGMTCFNTDGKIHGVRERFLADPKQSIVFILTWDRKSWNRKEFENWGERRTTGITRTFVQNGGTVKVLLIAVNGNKRALRQALSIIAS